MVNQWIKKLISEPHFVVDIVIEKHYRCQNMFMFFTKNGLWILTRDQNAFLPELEMD